MSSEDFLHKRHSLLVLLLVLLFTGQVIWLIHGQSLAYDEPAHTMSGALYWKLGYFQGGWDTPPFGQLIVGFPYGLGFAQYDPITALPPYAGRYMSLGLGLLFLGAIYFFARHLYGPKAGLLSLSLAALSPNIMAYSSVSTTDMSVTTLPFIAAPMLVLGRKGGYLYFALAGVSLGLGLAAKYSALLACAVIPWLCFYPLPREWSEIKKRLAQFLLICLAAWFAFSATFKFAGCFTAKEGIKNSKVVQLVAPILPTHAASGLDNQFGFAGGGRVTYLLGQWSSGGFLYYYPAIILMKTPLGTLLLFAVIIFWAIVGKKRPLPDLWYPPLAYLIILCIFNKEQTGLRHMLIAFPFLFVWCGSLATEKRLVTVALVLNVAICFLSFPFHLSYVNTIGDLLGKATDSGPFISAGPDVDWGQDENYVQEFLSSLPTTEKKWVAPRPRHVPHLGWVAVNAETMLRPSRFLERGGYDWLTPLTPQERFGGWLIYHVEAKNYVQLAKSNVARWSYQELLLRMLYWQKRWPEILLLTVQLEHIHPPAMAWRGRILLLQGKAKEALDCYEKLEKLIGPTDGVDNQWKALAQALIDGSVARALRLAYMLDSQFTNELRAKLLPKLKDEKSSDYLIVKALQAIDEGKPAQAYPHLLTLKKRDELPPSMEGIALSCRCYVEMGKRAGIEAEVNAGYHLIQIGMGEKGFAHTVDLHRKNPNSFEVIRVMNIFHLSRKVGLLSYDTGGGKLHDFASPATGQWIQAPLPSGR